MSFTKLLGLLLILLSSQQNAEGETDDCLTLNGQALVFEDNRNSNVRGGFRDRTLAISHNLEFSCYGHVTGWAAYAERDGTFDNLMFQVWRLYANNDCRTYQLVGSHSFNNIPTDNRLLNITSLNAMASQIPIPVQPGDVVGFYGDFSSGSTINIQSNPSTSFISDYSSPVTSAEAASLTVASTCSNLPGIEQGVPVIIAYVNTQDHDARAVATTTPLSEITSQLATTSKPTTPQLSSTLATTTLSTEVIQPSQTTFGMATFTTSLLETTAQSTTNASIGIQWITEGSTRQKLSTNDALGIEDIQLPLSTILTLSLILSLASGVVVVISCLIIGRYACRRLHSRKQKIKGRSNIISFNSPDDSRNNSDAEQNEAYAITDGDQEMATYTDESMYSYPIVDPDQSIEVERNNAYATSIVTKNNEAYKPVSRASVSETIDEYDYI